MKHPVCTLFFLTVILMPSCTYDYHPVLEHHLREDMVVINAYLSPDQDIKAELYKIACVADGVKRQGLQNVSITLYEEERVLCKKLCDSVFLLPYKPVENRSYKIVVERDSKTYTAATVIPPKITNKVTMNENKVTVSSFDAHPPFPLWITASIIFKNDSVIQFQELYSKDAFLDEINKEITPFVIFSEFGNIYYDGFLRISPVNISNVEAISFYPSTNRSHILSDAKCIRITLIRAGFEYDRYNRSSYQFFSGSLGDEFSPFFYQPKSIYSNIVNGVGIFAGYQVSHYDFPFKK